MRLVAGEPNATYVTINLGEIYIADNIKEQSFGLDGRLDELLPALPVSYTHLTLPTICSV